MAQVLRIVGGDGCCPCDQQVGCECSEIACARECRSKAGIAELCGYSELTSLSVPPKKFLKATFSGSLSGIAYNVSGTGGPCEGAPETGRYTYDIGGVAEYDPATCLLISTGTQTIVATPTGGMPSTFIDPITGPYPETSSCLQTVTLTPTTQQITPTGNCCVTALTEGGNPGLAQIQSGGGRLTVLTVEDTEEAAMERALPEGWNTTGSCLQHTAFRTQRGAGEYSFAFRKGQVRVRLPAVVIGHTYKVTVKYYERVLGLSGPFLPSGDQDEVTITADETEEYTPWLDVPQNDGFETVAALCQVEDITGPTPPSISGSSSAAATTGTPFNYQVTASGSPTGYSVSGTLPSGLTLNTTTGLISGTPVSGSAGSYTVFITATNSNGTSSPFTLTITVSDPG